MESELQSPTATRYPNTPESLALANDEPWDDDMRGARSMPDDFSANAVDLCCAKSAVPFYLFLESFGVRWLVCSGHPATCATAFRVWLFAFWADRARDVMLALAGRCT